MPQPRLMVKGDVEMGVNPVTPNEPNRPRLGTGPRQPGWAALDREACVTTLTDPLDAAIGEAMAQLETDSPEPEAAEPTAVEVEEPEAEGDEPEAESDEESEQPDEGDEEEQPESDDEPDEDSTEDDEESDEDDEGEGEEDDESESEPSELTEDVTYSLPDGTTVSGAELRDGYLRQQDYTRKTQEVATRRREVEDLYTRMADWYEDKTSDPGGWVAEIASGTDNPAGTLAGAVQQTQDPTGTLAWMIRNLAEAGKLDKDFVEAFGLEQVAGKAAAHESDDRVTRLEQRLEAEREQRERTARTEQALAQLEQQWQTIVSQEGLEFSTPQEEQETRIAVMQFARQNQIPDLTAAYAAKAYRDAKSGQPSVAPAKPKPKQDPAKVKQAVAKKRKTRAMTRTTAGGSAPKPRQPGDIGAAIAEAGSELGLDLS